MVSIHGLIDKIADDVIIDAARIICGARSM